MFSKTPTKGMRDFLPDEVRLRRKVLSVIQNTYESYGFTRIETPAVENLNLLCSKQGGDNEKLIYKILKRGEKLGEAAENNGELCDLGLRYDLTVPLARFYANNAGNLPSVFKAMQTEYVWRADRPQRGRYRQFMQCDIDIVGEESLLAETELIDATTHAMAALGFDNVTVRLSDRRILTALAAKCGLLPEQYQAAFIALDKMDKIGVTGVMEEIELFAPNKAISFIDTINRIVGSDDSFRTCVSELDGFLSPEVSENVADILKITDSAVKNGKVKFDVTLVRGMGYYTGTIYEISVNGLDISVGGGGRYDKMIGKITGTDVPACGFSLGFERLVMLINERDGGKEPLFSGTAVIVQKDADVQQLVYVSESCRQMRRNGPVTVLRRAKNFAFQLKQLKAQGFGKIIEYRGGEWITVEE